MMALAVVVLASFAGLGRGETTTVAKEAARVPKLVCEAPAHDFGSTPNVLNLKHVFVLKNQGSAPLTIERVKAACGCTATELSESVISPKGEA